ncbi:hypothetical protein M3Y99_00425300 [Aphelenchoides fujianensis]|nr:hypothetical protein M3Y99_00425300 [Aphelenchoides fujianensis]
MINWKLAVLLLGVVVWASDPSHVAGPRPDHEESKPFEFLGTGDEHQSRDKRGVHHGDNFAGDHGAPHRVARGIKRIDNFLGLKTRFVRRADLSGEHAGPRPDHEESKPFEFLGTGDEHQSRDARQVRSGEKDFAGEHGSGHRAARGIASGPKH